MVQSIDLNADLGESGGGRVFDDAAVLPLLSSANVACGFHAGEPSGIRATCRAAAALGVTIGAHPGYRDFEGFGRRFVEVDARDLTDEIIYQIGAVQAAARSVGSEVRYVKPHGALYNTIAEHEEHAAAVVRAIRELDDSLPLVVLPGSVAERVARAAGLRTVIEAFADRAYLPSGLLVPRSTAGAVHSPEVALEQALRLATERRVRAIDGSEIEIAADSLCLHGDSPDAVRLAAEVRRGLEREGVEIRSFA